jgi:hypothetical protein
LEKGLKIGKIQAMKGVRIQNTGGRITPPARGRSFRIEEISYSISTQFGIRLAPLIHPAVPGASF